MWWVTAVVCATLSALVQSVPPDKIRPFHIIKTRSIDLNDAYLLSRETQMKKDVNPTFYKLELEPYMEDEKFEGRVTINITALEDISELTLYAHSKLQIDYMLLSVKKTPESKLENIPIERTQHDDTTSTLKLYLSKTIPGNTSGQLFLNFSSSFVEQETEAFFKTSYNTGDEGSGERILVGTLLRPNHARKVFPCFDEPSYKTPFELSVVRPKNMIALSNTPVIKTEDIPEEPYAVLDHFKVTPPLSTFSVGLIIGQLEQVGNSTFYKYQNGDEIELRVWGRKEFLSALEDAPRRLNLVFSNLAEYWKVPLPLSRIDIVALPNYEGVKPADNWGLILFKESDLSGNGYLQLAQELSYQWLGALTTPAWWGHYHLNKALVGYVAAETTFRINNGSEMEGKWPMTVLYSLYYEFSKRFPHSRITGMKQETASTKIELLFRMFNYSLGADTFKKGVRELIENHKFSTFTNKDVWFELNKSAVKDGRLPKELSVESIVKSWLDKDRLPFVTAKRNYEGNSVHLNQKVFLRERPHDVPNADNMTWILPVVMIRSDKQDFGNSTPLTWVTTTTVELRNMPSKDHFIIINPQEIAPYVVNYDEHNWKLISKYLQTDNRRKIPELTRAKLLHDAWNLAYADELSFVTALDMTLFMKHERHHIVWDPVFTMIDHIGRHIDGSDVYDNFQTYIRTLLSPLYKELVKDESKAEVENWRKNLLSLTKTFLCKAGYRPCIREAQDQYKKWMEAPNPDEGNPIANQYICPVFKWGTKEEWEFGLQRVINFPSSRKQSERTYLLKTLAGCPVDEYKIERLLNLTVLYRNGNFSDTDIVLVLNMMNGGSKGYSTLFRFLRDNWGSLVERYPTSGNIWEALVSSATSHFTTAEGLELVKQLSKQYKGEFGSAGYIVERALKVTKEEANWSNKNLPHIRDWVNQYLANNDGVNDEFIGRA